MINHITNLNRAFCTNKQPQFFSKTNVGLNQNNDILYSNLEYLGVVNLCHLSNKKINFKGTEFVDLSSGITKKDLLTKLNLIENCHNNSSLSIKTNDEIAVNRVKTYVINNKTNLHKSVGLLEDIIDVVKEAEEANINISQEKIEETLENSKTSKVLIEILKNKIDFFKNTKAGPYYNEKYQIAERIYKSNLTISEINLNDLIKKYVDMDMYYFYSFINLTSEKNDYIQTILDLIDKTPKDKDEKLSQYLERIIQLQIENSKIDKDKFEHSIKSKLTYDLSTTTQRNDVKVTPYSHNLLARTINNIYCTQRYDTDTTVEELSRLWEKKYIDGIMVNLEKDLSEIVFAYFPKHNPENIKNETVFDYPPVYRWLKINDINTFLSDFENENTTYKYKKIQSCSTEKNYGEYNSTTGNVNFADWDSQYNVKFVIHPKSNRSNAVVLGENKYGNSEVLYSANQEFKYLGKIKHFVNSSDYEKLAEFNGQKHDSFYRWEIHLQEM